MDAKVSQYIDERWGMAEHVLKVLLRLDPNSTLHGMVDARRMWEQKLQTFATAIPDIVRSEVPLTYTKSLSVNIENPSASELALLNDSVSSALASTVGAGQHGSDAVIKQLRKAYSLLPEIPETELLDKVHNLCRFIQGRVEATPANYIVANKMMEGIRYRSEIDYKKGMKFSKVMASEFAYFYRKRPTTRERDILVDGANQVLSIFISGIKQSGERKVVMSLDPVDMLCASELTSGWSSCYHIGGAHAASPLAALVDKSTLIAYTANDMVGKVTHNGKNIGEVGEKIRKKIWRQWVHFDLKSGVAIADKEYPNSMPLMAHCAIVIAESMLEEAQRTVHGKDAKLFHFVTDSGVDDAGRVYTDSKGNKLFNPLHGVGRKSSWWVYRDPLRALIVVAPESEVTKTSALVGGEGIKDVHLLRTQPDIHYGTITIPCVACGMPRLDAGSNSALFSSCCNGRATAHYSAKHKTKQPDTPKRTCSACGTADDEARMTQDADGAWYCTSCYNDRYTHCTHCDAELSRDTVIYNIDGEPICDDCAQNNYERCECCEEYVYTRSDTGKGESWYRLRDGGIVCSRCMEDDDYVLCSSCGYATGSYEEVEDEYYCTACYGELFATCATCGEVTAVADLNADGYCSDCKPSEERMEVRKNAV